MRPSPPLEDEQLAEACKALGHPARLAIFRHLMAEDRCVCGRIVEIVPLAQSTVSQHLKVLREAGLVSGEVEGPRTCYCIDKAFLARFRRTLDRLADPAVITEPA
ncbi:metalloregulator ArsR/SmtB family transcription factor [Pseudodesulfovibrio sp.]|uniref:ArsR/SmtB family transcription factor n=1 Tax=Pseudodesulfovibrio sp. TaxID=2035812 RepID=UPI00260D7CA8|nr:metalloregulator ArsR/SmtB family transcription factor [Pseudodesulfovibrio sp.]MDD3312451.1 metalloregulator ArsR/SmtB family transcription factor [Pseudodesulfovibrio sp.]